MACLDGSELIDDVLAAATRLAGGRDFVLLVASDLIGVACLPAPTGTSKATDRRSAVLATM